MRFEVFSNPSFTANDLEKLFVAPVDQLSNSAPLKNILNYVIQGGCKTVIKEFDYVDSDFLSEYSSFYSRIFKKVENKCIRLHFFSKQFNDDSLLDLQKSEYVGAYLGFCVLRPIEGFRVGRTVLKPIKEGDNFFVLSKADFFSHIMGAKFVTRGMPFMQQDTSVGACAHACLWMLARYMHKKHLLKKILPYELTEFATRSLSYGRVMPNRKGINETQMLEGLRLSGLQCLYQTFDTRISENTRVNRQLDPGLQRKVVDVKRTVYPYLESEIPVILTIKYPGLSVGHALTVIGHTFDRNATPNPVSLPNSPLRYLSNISWIPALIVHNDNTGPYRLLLDHSDVAQENSLDKVISVMAPLPKEVSLFAEEVETNVVSTVHAFIVKAGIQARFRVEELVFRTYLRESNAYKAYLIEKESEISPDICNQYRNLAMPKYVWITEISLPAYINQSTCANRKIIGEAIVDSTGCPYGESAILAFRFDKFLLIQDVSNGNWDFIDLSNVASVEYPGLART